MAGNAARNLSLDLVGRSLCTPLELERRRLDRLRELRATIDALRHDASDDPLLASLVARPHTDPPPRD